MRIPARVIAPSSLVLLFALACGTKDESATEAQAKAGPEDPPAKTDDAAEVAPAVEPSAAPNKTAELTKPATEVEPPAPKPVAVEPDTVPIAPIALAPASVSWRVAASPSEGLDLVPLQAGVLAKGAGGYYDLSTEGQLVLREEIEAPGGTILGVWPKDAWFVERRETGEEDRSDEIDEIRLMRLRGSKRWVPQEYDEGGGQRWQDEGQVIFKSNTGGLLVAALDDPYLTRDEVEDWADVVDWERIADNGEAPEFGLTHGDQIAAFFETNARKFYTASKGVGRPSFEPEPGEDPSTAPAETVEAPEQADKPEAPADPVEAPPAPVEGETEPVAGAPEEPEVPAIFVQTYCEDLECVENRAKVLPLGVEWEFADQAPRKRHHLSALATNGERSFLLHYERKDWLLEEKTQAGTVRGMWPTKDGGLWLRVDDQLWHRDPEGGWRNIELPELTNLSVAVNVDKTELWIAGFEAGKPVVLATYAAAQDLPPEEPEVEGAKG